MARALFSRRAETDLLRIGEYTLRTWGPTQTDRYLSDMNDCCQWLAESPLLGRLCEEIRPGLRRFEQGEHVVFYRQHPRGILVSRILHRSIPPQLHSIEGES